MPSKNANIKQYQSTYKKKLSTRTEDGEHEAGRRILIHKVCQVDYVNLDADLSVLVTLNITKVGFQMNIINLTDFILGHHIALFRSGDSSHFSEQLG